MLTGVAKRLSEKMPLLFAFHCLAHRLALACADSASQVPFIKNKFAPTLLRAFYFFDNSPVRTAQLEATKERLGITANKIVKAVPTRWLSTGNAVKAMVPALVPVLTVMRELVKKDPAAGIHKIIGTFKFIAMLHLWNSVLPRINALSEVFQSEQSNLGVISTKVEACITWINVQVDHASTVRQLAAEAASGTVVAAAAADSDAESDDAVPADNDGVMAELVLGEDTADTAMPQAAQAPVPVAIVKGAAAVMPPDPIVRETEETIALLKQNGYEPLDSLKLRRDFNAARSAWLACLRDNMRTRLPEPEMFRHFGTLFDPRSLPRLAELKDNLEYGKASIAYFGKRYGKGKTPLIDAKLLAFEWSGVLTELMTIRDRQDVKAQTTLARLLAEFLSDLNRVKAPNMCKLAVIALTLPVSTADVERCFSDMNQIKSENRTRLHTARLGELMLLAKHGPEPDCVDWDAVLRLWYRQRQRMVHLVMPAAAGSGVDTGKAASAAAV